MHLTLATTEFAIYDDVLPPPDLSSLRRALERVVYKPVNAEAWSPVWRLGDGQPLRGPTAWLGAGSRELSLMGDLAQRIEECLPSIEVDALVGSRDTDWASLSLAPWIYPAGSGLSLHVDGTRYTGAFTFFFHERWKLHWGGWLVAFPAATAQMPVPLFDDTTEDRYFATLGVGQVIVPRPNRLVFLSGETPHLVSRVDKNAGDVPRLSVGGFFHRKT